MKKIHIATSPLTGTIFAGTIIKEGVWAAKQDVTRQAIAAVANHLLKNGCTVLLANESGEPGYEITINKINNTKN